MQSSRLLSVICIILLASCVDRLNFDIDLPSELTIAVNGHITNLPGPYQVTINKSFDTQSVQDLKTPISSKHVNLIDELGNDEELKEITTGIYQTSTTQGRVGGVYKIRVEFLDGRIYESIPDTLLMPGEIDSLYHDFYSVQDNAGAQSYGFDVLVNAKGNARNDVRYMWSMTGTFKAETHPELFSAIHLDGCYSIPEQFGKCNYIPLCTGLRNTASRNMIPVYPFDFERIAPCECCTCWYQVFNASPILSDDSFTAKDYYRGISIYKIPLSEWIFMFKIHVEVSQLTLTKSTFDFFKSIRAQKQAVGSLFQPITGKIPNKFIQVSGTPTPIYGIFYAAGASSKNRYILPSDVPYPIEVPQVDFAPRGPAPGLGWISCLELFPNATTTKPDFWID